MNVQMDKESMPRKEPVIASGWMMAGRRTVYLVGTLWPNPVKGDLPVEIRPASPRAPGTYWLIRGAGAGEGEVWRHAQPDATPVAVEVTGPPHPGTIQCPVCEARKGFVPCSNCGGEGRVLAGGDA